jgi:adenylate cyclase
MNSLIRRAQQVGLARAICVLLLFALVPLRLADPRPLQELRVRTFDFFQVLRPRPQEIRPVVIVDIDEASLKAIGQWPWPRTTVADLITQITQLGAVAIGFDIIFPEPDRMSPAIAERSFRGIDAETRAKLDNLPSNDDALAEVIKHSRVVVGQAGAAAAEVRPQLTRHCRPALPSAAPIRVPIWSPLPACCATCRRSSRRQQAAGFSRSIPKATASSGACR